MRCTRILSSPLLLAGFVLLSALSVSAQQTWWVQSADYGYGNQRQDVTNIVKRLVNGSDFRVNNTNMGGDPAVGRDKTLRIVARNSSSQVRDFYYKEGHTVPAWQFTGGPTSGRPGWMPGGPGWSNPEPPPGNGHNLWIVSARWGYGGQWMDVTSRLQGMVNNNRIYVNVTPETMGGDPIRGTPKELTVTYRHRGRQNSKVVVEGAILALP